MMNDLSIIPRLNNCLFLTGATGSGKTRLGIELAHEIDAEILSLDSMAIYRRMDIGTAKPTLEERNGVVHHMLDLVEPSDEYSLAQYVCQASQAVADIQRRGKIPLFVGGTPLYLKGLLRGIFLGPSSDLDFRAERTHDEETQGAGTLHRQLQEIDPVSAERLHPNDIRRIIRALEVYEKTGTPISIFQRQFEIPASPESVSVIVLDWKREILYDRINRRVDLMMEQGFLEEVQCLLADPQPLSRTASQAVGYRELIASLNHQTTLSEAIERTKQLSRNFAKRQGTWFRSFEECQFLSTTDDTGVNELLEKFKPFLTR